jgi:hypothetical protein
MTNQFWITGTIGSGQQLLEALIRYTSTLEFNKELIPVNPMHCFHMSGETQTMIPTMEIQDGRDTLELLKADIPDTNPRVVTVQVPMEHTKSDMVFSELGKHSPFVYISAVDPIFDIITIQTSTKDPKTLSRIFSPSQHVKQWDQNATVFADLERWQQREYLSGYIDYFFVDADKWQQMALNAGGVLYTTEHIFRLTERICRAIFNHLEIEIRDEALFTSLIAFWKTYQNRLLDDYESILHWKRALGKELFFDTQIPLRSLLYEAIIQRHLRKDLGIELRCAGLNTFPKTVRELQEYYE